MPKESGQRIKNDAERQKSVDAADTRKFLFYFKAAYGGNSINIPSGEEVREYIFSAALRFGIEKGEISFDWTDEESIPSTELIVEGEKKYVKISLPRRFLKNLESKLEAFLPGKTVPVLIKDKTYCYAVAISRARREGKGVQNWDDIVKTLAQAYQFYRQIEGGQIPTEARTNYAEMPPRMLLARIATTVRRIFGPIADQIIQELSDENREELTSPENPPHLGLTVASPQRDVLYRIHYFVRAARYPIAGSRDVHPRNEIVIEECEPQEPTESANPDWQALRLATSLALRRKVVFLPKKVAIFRKNQLISGDASLLPSAAEALDDAFPNWETSPLPLDYVAEVFWSYEAVPEKPVRPARRKFPNQRGGGGRLAPITVPIDDPKIRRR